MQKSILIVGRPSSGKTTKLNEILSKLEVNYLKCNAFAFDVEIDSLKRKSNVNIQCLVAEEVRDIDDVENLVKYARSQQMFFIATSQMSVKELSATLLSECEIISCEWSS
jgi:Cdc6-like AAA superfamily ATPase